MANDRNTPRRDGQGLRLPVAAAVRLYAGRMVGVNADGNAVPAGNAAAIAIVGIAQEQIDNRDGTAGAQSVNVRRGTFQLKPAAAGITLAAYGKRVKATDDESVSLVGEDAAAIVAGIVRDVDADGVWVEF
ncbi:hypothetical protein [Achromobacter sp. 2789STDY5608621]|uniref:hypothetical protein n=1 Tax=Achromobacter sp. 2789STDY5608621 TaxID=1806496 RepID=UPI0006BEE84E|nr:hypothetical protein [Achromobacter sp. 2789STDY5608621]CUJ55600.1 Uncharacterised protein [Achromobacter sp. 2789STDY5608621]